MHSTRHMGGFGVFYGLVKAWHWSMLFSRSLAVYLSCSIILSFRIDGGQGRALP
jgi:hypothetical protein